MKTKPYLLLIGGLVLSTLLLIACSRNTDTDKTPPNSQATVLPTNTAENTDPNSQAAALPTNTTESAATIEAPAILPTNVPENENAPTTTPILLSDSQATNTPTSIPVENDCTPRSSFVTDVTIPDNSVMAPGQTFVKTWRLQNNGSCTWTTTYQLVFVSHDSMGALPAVPLNQEVAPGGIIDLSINLTAPTVPDTHFSFWQLRTPDGTLFGVTAYAQIVVYDPNPVPTAVPTQPPIATAVPTQPPIATAVPTQPPIATAVPTQPPIATVVANRPPIPTVAPTQPPPPTAVPKPIANLKKELFFALGGGGGGGPECDEPPQTNLPTVQQGIPFHDFNYICIRDFPVDGTITVTLEAPNGTVYSDFFEFEGNEDGMINQAILLWLPVGLPTGEWNVVASSANAQASDSLIVPNVLDVPAISVIPDLNINPFQSRHCETYSAGEQVEILGANFPPTSKFRIGIYKDSEEKNTLGGTIVRFVNETLITTDSQGEFQTSVVIDESYSAGRYYVFTAIDQITNTIGIGARMPCFNVQ